MVRVLGLVSFRIFPTHMGGQKGVALFYAHLRHKAEVTLAASHDNRDSGPVDLERMLYPNKKIYLNLFRIAQLKQLVRRKQVDVIVAEHSYTGWLAWLLHRATGKPFLIHSHNIESRRFRHMHHWWWPLYAAYEGWIHRRAHHSFFISAEDLQHAVASFRLEPARCSVITYGITERRQEDDRPALRSRLGLAAHKTLLLFNGTLDYQPNYDAVVILAEVIEPLLRKTMRDYQIVITGNRAPRALVRKMQENPSILYAGYVADVDLYYQSADLFLNPVRNDTGVKTKLIEAMANHCAAISTASGASGIRADLCGDQLTIVADDDWPAFAEQIANHRYGRRQETPAAFFEAYRWENIATTAAHVLGQIHDEPSEKNKR